MEESFNSGFGFINVFIEMQSAQAQAQVFVEILCKLPVVTQCYCFRHCLYLNKAITLFL